MKKYLLIFLAALGACQEENSTIYSVDPALSPYVDTFYAEAAERGVIPPRNLIAEFKGIQAGVEVDMRGDQNYLFVHPTTFERMGAGALEVQIYSRLGGLFLKRSTSEDYSFMNPDIYAAYNPADKEALFDELFGL